MALYPQQAPLITAAGGTANALTATFANISSMANLKLVTLTILLTGTNTGPATLNINGLGVFDIYKPSQSGLVLLSGSELVNNVPVQLYWAGTFFVLSGPIPLPGFTPIVVVHGCAIYDNPGDFTFTVPANVYFLQVATTGGGGGATINDYNDNFPIQVYDHSSGVVVIGQFAATNTSGSGGGGGTAVGVFPVTPGDVITLHVGDGGTGNAAGGDTVCSYLTGGGGRGGSRPSPGAGGGATGGMNFNGQTGNTGFLNLPMQSLPDNLTIAGGVAGWSGAGPGQGASSGSRFTDTKGRAGAVVFTW